MSKEKKYYVVICILNTIRFRKDNIVQCLYYLHLYSLSIYGSEEN